MTISGISAPAAAQGRDQDRAAASAVAPVVSVVVPVYREGEHVLPTLQAIAEHVPAPHEVLVIYDVDDDSTLPVVRRLAQTRPHVRAVKNRVARGPSGALRTGFEEATAPAVLVVMGDGSDDLAEVSAWLRWMSEGVDIVVPSRYCQGGEQLLAGTILIKAWVPWLAGWLLHRLAGLPYDPTNSFKLYSGRMLKALRLRSTQSFSVTLEIVAKAHVLGYEMREIPTVWRDRRHGTSRFRLGRAIVTYLPWFGVALLRNRVARVPARWLARWCGAPRAMRGEAGGGP
ncbi:MAG: glycosyltransferase family 2 protein [Candidatus Omnitrophica bacterium]|nr:glycosyltransferase family 2 protein [Candidatus Omnitrophota bacterium]